jgi:N-acyl amino acid synthase of PEP-CTERM/exosortase system
MTETEPSLAQAFNQFFEIVPANTDTLRDVVYRIRYQVYCHELHFEDEANYPDGRELDEFDAHSAHCLLRHRPSGEFAGCVRLVLNEPGIEGPQLPLEQHCSDSLDKTAIDLSKLDRSTFAEVSRLAVAGRFRRRPGEAESAHGVTEESIAMTLPERRVFPHIALGLYLAAGAMSLRRGLDIAVVMMEPRLARHMKYFGIEYRKAGDVINYHGLRGPYYCLLKDNLNKLKPEIRDLLSVVSEQLD